MSKLMGISLITMSVLYGLLVALAVGVSLAFDVSILPALIGGVIVLLLQFLLSPWIMDLTTRWLYRADFNAEMPEYLKTYITEVCQKYKIKYPKIGYIDDGAPNAYTYGRTKKDARIILTRGIFELLNPEEVKAVVAHELGHVAHYDMVFMTVAQLIPIVLYAVYDGVTSIAVKDSDNDSSKAAVVGYIAYVLYIISQYIVLWLSRTREYYADDFAITETKSVNHLSEALVKIGYGLTTGAGKHDMSKVKGLGIFDKNSSKTLIVSSYKDGMINKGSIKNSMKWEKFNTWAKYYELNSTHPMISKRLLKISERSSEFNEQPYIVFDLKKEGVSFGTFLKELFILIAPYIAFLATIVVIIVTENKFYLGIGGLITMLFAFIRFFKRNNKNFKPKTVEELLGEVNVSKVTTIPCIMEGKVIGRGDPGGILSEDLVIKDSTGIMFMNYNQPLGLWNKIVALFKTSSYLDTNVLIKGWYMRGPVPYVEIFTMEVNGKIKRIYSYYVKLFLMILLTVVSLILLVL